MRNIVSVSKKVMSAVESLPLFSFHQVRLLGAEKKYQKILLSRKAQSGEVIRLKKGLYTSRAFVEQTKQEGRFSDFVEYLATQLYPPSYLSLEYVLYQHHLLTEVPVNFTLVSTRKTAVFRNRFGTFLYHSLAPALFKGFVLERRGGFVVAVATPAKALFDFIYLRRHLLKVPGAIHALRLNISEMKSRDVREFKTLVRETRSARLQEISRALFSRHA